MINERERKERKKQIGASEIYLLNNFDTKGAINLFNIKTGKEEQKEILNKYVIAGDLLEEDCLKAYEKYKNIKLTFNERIESPTVKNVVASLDARRDDFVPIENKVIKYETFKKWKAKKSYNALGKDGRFNIPKKYYYQIQLQMHCTKSEKGILLANTFTEKELSNPLLVEVEKNKQHELIVLKNDDLIKDILNRAIYFLDCVKNNKLPNEKEYLFER